MFLKISNLILNRNHGDYTNPIQAKKYLAGRLIMSFKTWIPNTVNNHFGAEHTDLEGNTTKGLYMSLGEIFKDGSGAKSFEAFRDNLFTLYSKDPTLSSLKPIDKQNINVYQIE